MAGQSVVLVIDDDQAIIDFIELALAEEGYEVVGALNGLQALEKLRLIRPDVILLDLGMPEMNGEEFCRHLREEGRHSPPIVVMTASSTARQKAEELEAAGWLGKPFELTELIACVERHCGPQSERGSA